MAAPRRLQTRTAASSTSPPLSFHPVASWVQKTRAARGHVSRALRTMPPSIGSQRRYGRLLAGSGLRATWKRKFTADYFRPSSDQALVRRRRRRSSDGSLVARSRLTSSAVGSPRSTLGRRAIRSKQLPGLRASNFALQDSLDVVGQSLSAGSGAPGELPVEPIRHVPYLDHLGHAISISAARCMRDRSFKAD